MCKQGGSTALILAASGFLLFLAGCETSKHAEVMGDESLAAKQRAEQMQVSDSGGIPLSDQGLSQETISGLPPEGPPGATLRGLDRGSVVGEEMASISEPDIPETVSPAPPPIPQIGEIGQAMEKEETPITAAAEPGPAFDPGSSGYEGQDFESGRRGSEFLPQGPPLPTFGEEPSSEPEAMVKVPEVMAATPPPPPPPPPPPLPSEVIPMEAEREAMPPSSTSEVTDVFFDFDKYAIRSDAAATLVENARILRNEHQGAGILIEGHCDERGTEEYNMVLGERRAQAVKNYLVDLGVSASNIKIVSYGKERPFCTEQYDACWDQNRRGHFVIQ